MAFIRLAVKTVVAFLICWLPISIYTIAKSSAIKINPNVESTFFTFAFANSLINPFIYFAHMRKAIAAALGCIKSANFRSISLRGDVTQETINSKETICSIEKVINPISVQPKVVVSSSQRDLDLERNLIYETVTVHDKKMTNAHLEVPKTRAKSLVK